METTLQTVIIVMTVPTIAEMDLNSISAIVAVDHVIYRQVSLTFIASASLKLSFILNFASKLAYDLTTI